MEEYQFVWLINITKSSQKFCNIFGNVRLNSVAPHAFVDVVKVTNYTGLYDGKLARYYMPNLSLWLGATALEYTVLVKAN